MGGATVGEIIGAALVCVLSWTGGCLNWQHHMNDVVKGCVLFAETPEQGLLDLHLPWDLA